MGADQARDPDRPSVDRDKIRHKIQFIRDNVRRLRTQAAIPTDEFVSSALQVDAALRRLQVAIEAMLDIAHHVIAREGFGLPQTYREAMVMLCDAGVLPTEQKDAFTQMVRFRNRAVHLYDAIDPAEVHAILTTRLGDFDSFIHAITRRYLS